MQPKTFWIGLVPALGCLVAACSGEIIDDFGTSGYAQLQGTALRADGSRFANVFVTCGPEAPGEFGGLWNTDSVGRFDITLAAPATPLPPDETLVCAIHAPGDAPRMVSDTLVVPFTKERAARITTVVTLQAQ